MTWTAHYGREGCTLLRQDTKTSLRLPSQTNQRRRVSTEISRQAGRLGCQPFLVGFWVAAQEGESLTTFEAGGVGFWLGVSAPRSRDVLCSLDEGVGAALGCHRKHVPWFQLRKAAHASLFGLVMPVVTVSH